MHMSSSN
nr:unnamed protein product [Callosobruchus analis]